MKSLVLEPFSLMVDFCSKWDNFKWHCTTVYGPNARTLKRAFWEELRECGDEFDVPCIVCGDFNAIFDIDGKLTGAQNLADIRNANTFLFDLGLLELPSVGRKFTWTNGQADLICVKLG